MAEQTEAERYLLKQIREGRPEGWAQLVERYQGRLLAFAQAHLRNVADAEDAVQDAFLGLIKGLAHFREDASLETYLFTLLRRRLIDLYRGRSLNVCSLQDGWAAEHGDAGEGTGDLGSLLPNAEPSGSWYVRRDEDQERLGARLRQGLRQFIDQLKSQLEFKNLRIAEMIFYAQLRNKEIARRVGVDEGQVALLKHRFLKRIARKNGHDFEEAQGGGPEVMEKGVDEQDVAMRSELFAHAALLTQAWEDLRPSCPKRSTIGAFLLDTLDDDWREYVAFHLHELGCRFCRANLNDLERQANDAESTRLRDRIMQSSVGFLKKA